MKLVADSGSTKTDWRLITPQGEQHHYRSEGINPYFHTPETVAQTLGSIDFGPFEPGQIEEVYFYSAGSSTAQNKALMEQGFKAVFANARVEIIHDLLGAARALFQADSGLTAILGTGSNSCLFVNGKIVTSLGGHGYILGDEGSGMHIGRKVIRDFMSDLMPADVLKHFQTEHNLSKDQITHAVYKQHFPNRFLASFSKFVKNHIDHPYFQALVDDAFMKFFERYIIQYEDYRKWPLRVLGSVGYHFSEQLYQRAEIYEVRIDKILQAPIDGLVAFHTGAHQV